MKKRVLSAVALLALSASVASAAGLNLVVNGCDGDATPSANLTNPCTANTGQMAAVASYVAPAGISALGGIELVVEVQTAGAALPPWWDIACRRSFLRAEYAHAEYDNPTCEDAWGGAHVFGGGTFRQREDGPNRGLMIIGWAVLPNNMRPLAAGTEYYAGHIAISRLNTTSCTGCLEPACLVFNQVMLAQPVGTPGGNQLVTEVASGNFIRYQGGAVPEGCPPGFVPTQNRTWGRLKSLYR